MLFDQLLDVPPCRIGARRHDIEDERVVQHLLDEANEPVGPVRVQEIVAAARGRGGGTHGGGSGGGSARAGCGRTRGRMEIDGKFASLVRYLPWWTPKPDVGCSAHGHTPTHIHTPTWHGPWGSNVDKSQAAAVRPEGALSRPGHAWPMSCNQTAHPCDHSCHDIVSFWSVSSWFISSTVSATSCRPRAR